MDPIIQKVDEKNILTLVIDGKNYLFKLSDYHDIAYLKKLRDIVEKKIQENKKLFSIKDYLKLLILTCLNLSEDIYILQKKLKKIQTKENISPLEKEPDSNNTIMNLELIERLESIIDSLSEKE